ncbi:XRE family transcriptional regulator [Duganella violaceipulchra]|uniref:Helix-turn-helix domain-containing protein n=1 Tax=Duganella violaceipulchra TaxID=2849652 RepID=A0AA41HE97_9BURK|nr:XRE family transcriptional regulator [Duganella violaceicalia]MBV6322969.1 helix-turn-helix domain-containing protein [Duganella violaceicalia]MCP2008050.1 transcriptional regulator with XRE-family HTH domain [Duganella violaceicalia]
MGRNLNDVINNLQADRQKKIAALSHKKIEEMIAHAATLTDFRKAVGKTQVEVAKDLGINQNAVSQLEKRSDTYVSTLRRFLKSLGLTLELSVLDKNGVRIDLQNFLQWSDRSVGDDAETFARAAKPPARKTAVKAPAKEPVAAATKRATPRAKRAGA